MNNYSAKGYLMKALNYMIKENMIDAETAKNVMTQMHVEFDLMTESEAENYYRNNFIEE